MLSNHAAKQWILLNQIERQKDGTVTGRVEKKVISTRGGSRIFSREGGSLCVGFSGHFLKNFDKKNRFF